MCKYYLYLFLIIAAIANDCSNLNDFNMCTICICFNTLISGQIKTNTYLPNSMNHSLNLIAL